MIREEKGFTMVELLITMVVFVFVMAAGSQIFSGLLTQFKQQSKIAETNIEGIVGLEILRQDIEHAGYGLPWNIPSGTIYSEASSLSICGSANPSTYNDTPSKSPRAIVSGNDNCTNGSDYLVIKAVNVDTNGPSSKWTELIYAPSCVSPYNNFATKVCKRTWSPSTENLSSSDNVIVISPGATAADRSLKANSGAFSATSFDSIDSSWLPTGPEDNIRIIYGLNNGNAPKRPFNRADYYISTNVPQRCAPNTGVLQKATMDYNGGFNQLPLIDCVADFQVVYGVDTDSTPDEILNCYVDNLADVFATVDAENIRTRVKEIRVYLLAHEGQMDRSFNFQAPINPSSIRVGEPSINVPGGNCTGAIILGRDFDLSGITDWQNFRWKVYTMIVKPNNLR